MKALVAQLFVVSVVKSYGETDEFFVVSGSFGDAWKDKGFFSNTLVFLLFKLYNFWKK